MVNNTRHLGNLATSSMGLGCMGMTEIYESAGEKAAIEVIHQALDSGVTLLDTADMYGFGDNERLLKKALRHKRKKAVIATKFGIVCDSDNPQYRGINGTPEYVRCSCEKSLKRLGTDYIDLYFLHHIDPNVPIEDTIGAMSQLVAKGKVRHIGILEAEAKTIRRANAVHPLAAVQTEYSLLTRYVEQNDVLKTTQELKIGFVAYGSLCHALIIQDFNSNTVSSGDACQFMPRFQGKNLKANKRLIDQLSAIANEKGCSLPQLSIAWLLAQGENIVPIPGTKRLADLKDNLGALNIMLREDELAEIRIILEQNIVHGERYPENVINDHNLGIMLT